MDWIPITSMLNWKRGYKRLLYRCIQTFHSFIISVIFSTISLLFSVYEEIISVNKVYIMHINIYLDVYLDK